MVSQVRQRVSGRTVGGRMVSSTDGFDGILQLSEAVHVTDQTKHDAQSVSLLQHV